MQNGLGCSFNALFEINPSIKIVVTVSPVRHIKDGIIENNLSKSRLIQVAHHLKDKSACTLESFCQMIAEAAARYGAQHLGLGSDLCQDQPDRVVEWMRVGRWSKAIDYGEGSASAPGFPPMPSWFQDNRDFGNIAEGLRKIGMSELEVAGIMGENWYRFYQENFGAKA